MRTIAVDGLHPLRLRWAARVADSPMRQSLLIAVAWRAGIAIWGAVAHFVMTPGKYAHFSLLHSGWPRTPLNLVVDAEVRIDSFWYARVAAHGYTYSTHHESSIVFYPLFPILIKLGSFVFGNIYISGLLISTASFFLAMILFVQWLRDRGLEGKAPIVIATLLCFPFALFYSAMYTESLYLALALATFVTFEHRRWSLSALCAFLLVLCRPTGIIVLPCLGLLLLRERRVGLKPLLPIAAGLVAIAGFAVYQWVVFGTPLASTKAQAVQPWSRTLSQGVSDFLLQGRPGFSPVFLGFQLGIALVFLALVPLVYKRFGSPYALFAALSVLVPATVGLTSMERFVIVDFPVFALMAFAKRKIVTTGLLTVGAYLLLLFTALFVDGYSVF